MPTAGKKFMGNNLVLMQNPFAVLTFIAAPAILTSASSVLAMSTINRMLRARERMHQLYDESKSPPAMQDKQMLVQVDRVEQQGLLLVNALRWIYVAIGAFAAASLVTLLGAGAGQIGSSVLMHIIIVAGLLLGFTGVGGLIGGCVNLFKATELSLVNIREEAELIRARRKKSSPDAL
jgi:hypothetical protein